MSRFGDTAVHFSEANAPSPGRFEPTFVGAWTSERGAHPIVESTPIASIWDHYNGEVWCQGNNRKAILPELLATALGPNPGPIVNLMCGQYSFCPSTLGVDINAQVLRGNRQIAYALVHDLDDPSKPLPIADAAFDNAVLMSGVAYLQFPEHLFGEARRIIRPQGTFYLGFDGCCSPEVTPQWEALDHKGRMKLIRNLAADAGLVVSQVATAAISAFHDGIVEWPYYLAALRPR